MPLYTTDYSKTIIYKICCKDVNITDVYIGYTTDLKSRRKQHKHNSINDKRDKYKIYLYQFIRNNGGWENWSCIPVEEYKCENKNQALIRERYWIEELKPTLNKNQPIILTSYKEYHKEYRERQKENIKEYRKDYQEKNKEKINECQEKINEYQGKIKEYQTKIIECQKEYQEMFKYYKV